VGKFLRLEIEIRHGDRRGETPGYRLSTRDEKIRAPAAVKRRSGNSKISAIGFVNFYRYLFDIC